MLKFTRRIIASMAVLIPFFGPISKVGNNIKTAAPAAVSPAGSPHLILLFVVPFVAIMAGANAAMFASIIAAGLEVFVLSPKSKKGSREWKMANAFAVLYIMGALAIAQTEWLLS